ALGSDAPGHRGRVRRHRAAARDVLVDGAAGATAERRRSGAPGVADPGGAGAGLVLARAPRTRPWAGGRPGRWKACSAISHVRPVMEIILREDVQHLGKTGEVVKVKDGYARNFLLPKGLAYPATEGNKKKITYEAERIAKQRAAEKGAAETEAARVA